MFFNKKIDTLRVLVVPCSMDFHNCPNVLPFFHSARRNVDDNGMKSANPSGQSPG